ncbi:phosphoadenylyl-sulfate reductase [Streptacidiphilus sp. NEAU-YB345]|uniref:Adenosine 5'-phosphosulfate reductase n=1 Tax=Streptacidiphilus fuscans TaxID=2789292 RepID=A0A931FIS5_9ACTN|nr:phosphoadenylyl-sulfate reductase [Streptacidiphilus fuscans]
MALSAASEENSEPLPSAAPRVPPPVSPADLRTLAESAAALLEDADAADVIAWARREFGSGLVVASSMADTHLVHLAQRVVPGIDVLFLDTGYHFAETIGTRDAVATVYDVNVVTMTPHQTVAEQALTYGPHLYQRDPDRCCALRKVEPLERGLAPYRAWITGMRREDAPTRAGMRVVEYDKARNKITVAPLARWTQQDVDAYVTRHQVLVNPLLYDGYTSVGCAPCTRRPSPGADPRSGRWVGSSKTECGLRQQPGGSER